MPELTKLQRRPLFRLALWLIRLDARRHGAKVTVTGTPGGGDPRDALRDDLLAVFRHHDLDVGVGLTGAGVAIRSQDERVDATNLGRVEVRS